MVLHDVITQPVMTTGSEIFVVMPLELQAGASYFYEHFKTFSWFYL